MKVIVLTLRILFSCSKKNSEVFIEKFFQNFDFRFKKSNLCLCFLSKVGSYDVFVNISQELISSFTLLKEELATPLLNITAIPFQPRIGTMTVIAVTVLRNIKEAGGILTVITQTLMVSIVMKSSQLLLLESDGIAGKKSLSL